MDNENHVGKNLTLDDFTWAHVFGYTGGDRIDYIDKNGRAVYYPSTKTYTGYAKIFVCKRFTTVEPIPKVLSMFMPFLKWIF